VEKRETQARAELVWLVTGSVTWTEFRRVNAAHCLTTQLRVVCALALVPVPAQGKREYGF